MIITLKTNAQTELIDITANVEELVAKSEITEGLCFIFIPHTTAAVTINECADPDVKTDMLMALNQIVPWEAPYRHSEGNSPAHVKSSLMGTSELIAIENGRLALGTWQGLFFCEFDGPRQRKVRVKLISA